MPFHIYKPARNIMQSGTARSALWILDYTPSASRQCEPLMGWTSSDDTRQQIKLYFESKEQAVAYAQVKGLDYILFPEPPVRKHKKSYSDNFKYGRQENWTH